MTNLSVEQQAALAAEQAQRRDANVPIRNGPAAMGPPSAMARPKSTYQYTNIADISPNNVYNIYGVVVAFKGPNSTRGMDWMMSVRLVDPSQPESQHGLNCVLFGRQNALPRITAVGQILRVHRLKTSQWQGKLQGQSQRQTSYLVLSGEVDADISRDVANAPGRPTLEDQDFEMIRDLRQWRARGVNMQSQYEKRICDLDPTTHYADMMLQVLSSRMQSTATCDVCDLIAWDGTCNTTHTVGLLNDRMAVCEPELPATSRVARGKFKGDLMKLTVWGHLSSEFQNVPLGKWMYFRNVSIQSKNGGLEGKITDQSSVTQVAPSDLRVVMLLQEYEKLVLTGTATARPGVTAGGAQGSRGMALPSLAAKTQVWYKEAPVTRLVDVLASSDVPNKFRVRAAVKYWTPGEEVDICKFVCPGCRHSSPLTGGETQYGYTCAYCTHTVPSDSPDIDFIYAFRLKLDDGTAFVDAYVYGDDGVDFFKGLKPCNLRENRTALEKVQDSLQELILDAAPTDFCIMSYRKIDDPTLVHYRVFATTVVSDGEAI